MVNLIINEDYIVPFVGNFNPINFHYNLTSNRIYPKEGEVIFKDIENNLDTPLSNIYTLSIKGEKNKVQISNFITSNINYSENNKTMTITLKFKNLFDIFEKLTMFFNLEFDPSHQTYDCFSTSMNCNLSCDYCVYSCNSNVHHPYLSLDIGHYYITQVREIIDRITNPEFKVARIMGGETLININDFNDVLDYIKRNYEYLDDLWIYTNLTINVDKFINIVHRELEIGKIKKFTIIFTSDSLNDKSQRIHSPSIMNNYVNNIKTIIKEFKNDPRVLIASNLMFTDEDETYNTAIALYNMGVQFIQISYDEFSSEEEALRIKSSITKVYNRISDSGIKRLKPNLGKVMWYHFFITVDNDCLYQCKFSFKSDYVISRLNNY